ncbi:MAG: LamB/YcsF family protein [Synergistales bacterium]|jgi:UPF0271 protein|nr:LamB/YcsF family protein [Synergistales bacterium]
MNVIDLNSDLGESFGAWTMGNDSAVLRYVSSANVACGFHAGDPQVMLATARSAKAAGVTVGAHPGYPDLVGFGRRNLSASPDEAYAFTLYQIGAMDAVCHSLGLALQHVKPHGALYNQAAKDSALARAIARAVRDVGGLILMGLAGSCMAAAAAEAGIPFAAEAFADRAYRADGTLLPRREPGAVIHDVNEAVNRVVRMATEGVVEAVDGSIISFRPHSICLHGDNAEAVEMAREIRKGLETSGVTIRPLKEILQ